MEKPFKNGQVISITLEKFMVYARSVTLNFKPGLNVILGVNGSGKSSVLVGLFVGLGGDLVTIF
jgi:chromosome segregation ATPase